MVIFSQSRFIESELLVRLTERIEHLDVISNILAKRVPAYVVLHGRMSKKQRATTISELEALPADERRILLAIGKLLI